MNYSTSDLSKILGVSGNTIRRYDEMGYLTGERDEENGYRRFSFEDVERLMYVTKYRREEFSHDEVSSLLMSSTEDILSSMEKKREAIQSEIARLSAIDHLLKDDQRMINRAKENLNKILRKDNQPMHFIRYMVRDELCITPARAGTLRRFMEKCPEFYYMYLFEKEDVEKGSLSCSSGVGTNTIMTEKYGFEPDSETELYPKRPSILRFTKMEMDIDPRDLKDGGKTWQQLFGPVFEYMSEEGLKLTGDVMALKIGSFYEAGRLMQYLLFHFPIG